MSLWSQPRWVVPRLTGQWAVVVLLNLFLMFAYCVNAATSDKCGLGTFLCPPYNMCCKNGEEACNETSGACIPAFRKGEHKDLVCCQILFNNGTTRKYLNETCLWRLGTEHWKEFCTVNAATSDKCGLGTFLCPPYNICCKKGEEVCNSRACDAAFREDEDKDLVCCQFLFNNGTTRKYLNETCLWRLDPEHWKEFCTEHYPQVTGTTAVPMTETPSNEKYPSLPQGTVNDTVPISKPADIQTETPNQNQQNPETASKESTVCSLSLALNSIICIVVIWKIGSWLRKKYQNKSLKQEVGTDRTGPADLGQPTQAGLVREIRDVAPPQTNPQPMNMPTLHHIEDDPAVDQRAQHELNAARRHNETGDGAGSTGQTTLHLHAQQVGFSAEVHDHQLRSTAELPVSTDTMQDPNDDEDQEHDSESLLRRYYLNSSTRL